MTRSTELLLRVALVLVIGWVTWNLAAVTVVQLITQRQTIDALQRQLTPEKK